ncbi:hypothetical protein GCM10017673_56250 [Streptosporangium violaceochromogenes]|nr:hypothetical protein GCM10017673_56250 [Streptosporangium violaceochromogenes]
MTYAESVFDQDDIPEDSDQIEIDETTYRVTVTRTGKNWTATVHDLPDGHAVRGQGATWKETRDNVIECVYDLLGLSTEVVSFQFIPADPQAEAAVKAVSAARAARAHAEQAERDAVYGAIRTLMDQGWTSRDIGSALGFSHQRISQIAPRATK